MKSIFLVTLAAVGLSSTGCFFVSKKPAPAARSSSEHKNHGQERKEEVHERNDARKAEHDAEKGKK